MKALSLRLGLLLVAGSTLVSQTATPEGTHFAAPPVRRTTEAMLDQQVTAKDLIGRDIYDRQNNHIGEVVDVALGGVVPEQLKTALAKSDRDSYAASSVAPAPGNDTGEQPQAGSPASTDRERDDQPTTERVQAFATSTVYISVGGILGIGSELVRAPLSALGYDRRHDRIVLDMSSDELKSVLKTAAISPRIARPVTVLYGR